MKQSMRWYGPHDGVKLGDIRQSGATEVVTALHHIPVGEIWTVETIKDRQKLVRHSGLEWKVVESLPVHEDIKRGSGRFREYIENYKQSLINLASCGIEVVTYNFMPVLDWVRTETDFINDTGTTSLRFSKKAFCFADVFLLKRPGASQDYSKEELEEAKKYGESLKEEERKKLFNTILLGLPGSTVNFTPHEVLDLLKAYSGINKDKLRKNLIRFLSEVAPLAEKEGIQLAIHPDDPPFSVLGLPRIVCTEEDISFILEKVPEKANGLCFCTGSLGANPQNDITGMLEKFGERVHFVHLRNIIHEGNDIFRESDRHIEGHVPMEKVMEILLKLMNRRGKALTVRPDHGSYFSMEPKENRYPGYSFIGRLNGLAELRGLELGIMQALK
jgi:mannonate dehydratase